MLLIMSLTIIKFVAVIVATAGNDDDKSFDFARISKTGPHRKACNFKDYSVLKERCL